MHSKHLYIFLFSSWLAASSNAQTNQPQLGQHAASGINGIYLTPAEANTAGDVSYIRSFAPLVPITDTAMVSSTSQPGNIRQQTVYLGGFMEPFQTVTRNVANVNGQASHLVQITDNRPLQDQYSFLPYASNTSGLQTNAFLAQRNYHGSHSYYENYTAFSMTHNSSDASQYSVTTYAPGKSQVGQSRGTVVQSLGNFAHEVIVWDLDSNGIPVFAGYYDALQLFEKQTTAPKDGGSSVTAPQSKIFTDRDGKLILKMIAAKNAGGVITYDYTYYVYDVKGALRCTITPKAFKYYQDNGGFSGEAVANLCFQYRYDTKGRLIAAQKPGEQGFTTLVYDRKDRPVMRQTPNGQAAHQWEVSFFDATGRSKATSVFTDAGAQSREDWQGIMDDAATNGAPANTLPYYLATAAGEPAYPDDNITGNEMMSYIYYDDYSIIDPNGNEWNDLSTQLNFTETISSGAAELPERSANVYGAVTGTMVRILPSPNADPAKTGNWRKTVLFYDRKGRPVFTAASDRYGNTVIHSNMSGTQYDFADRILITKHAWYNANSIDAIQGHAELTKYTYDALSGALLNTKHKVDDGVWNTLNTFTYDETGRVKRKSLGGGAEVQDMDYNIRGQLAGINSFYAESGNKENYSRSFGESIKYDYGFTLPRYDGKMAGLVWRGSNANQMLAYGYDYTQGQLLKSADFNYYTGVLWQKTALDYTVSNLTYDANGNIASMKQRGTQPGVGPVNMDVMTYSYPANSNRLDAVSDSGVPDYGAGDFQDVAANKDYSYDLNGNLKRDANKGISTDISYTHFNKPVDIALGNGNIFSYSYDATGNKAQELLINSSAVSNRTTDYIGNAVYENDALKYILTPEGRTRYIADGNIFSEEYFVKDHLGNIRSTISAISYMPRTYLAGYEIASANLEQLIFDNIDELRETKPGGDPENSMAAKLNGSDPKARVGSALLLHVMAGDKISMKVDDYYDDYNPAADTPVTAEDMIANVITTLTGGYNGFEGESHDTRLVNEVFTGENSAAYSALVADLTAPDKPKAYLNYVMFDENMTLMSQASGAFQASHQGSWGEIGSTEAMEMQANGYLAVYLSNATIRDVYFDRLRVEVVKGKLLEESHYYPHGLPIAGLSSSDHDLLTQRRRYQGNEYIRDGLDWMSFGARQYDPQMGRFLSVDPLAAIGGQDRISPYAAMGNQPGSSIDPNGLKTVSAVLERAQAITPDGSGGFATDMNWVLWGVRGDNSGAGATYNGAGGGSNGGSISYVSEASRIAYWTTVMGLPQGSYYMNDMGGLVNNATGEVVYGKGPGGAGKGSSWAYIGAGKNEGYGVYGKRYLYTGGLNDNDNTPIIAWRSDKDTDLDEKEDEKSAGLSSDQGLWLSGAIFTATEKLSGISRLGTNGTLYRATASGRVFYGNQYVKTFGMAKIGQGLGIALAGFSTIMDIRGVHIYNKNPNAEGAVSPGRATTNLGMNLYGIFIGPVAPMLYFGIEAFYPGGWLGDGTNPGAIMDQSRMIEDVQRVVPNFNMYNDALGGW